MKHKKLFITATAIFTAIVALAIFVILWYWGDTYPDFNETTFRKEVDIPGRDDGATPQGITVYKGDYKSTSEDGGENTVKQDFFFISAYMKNGASRLYVTGKTSGYVGYVTLKHEDGSDYTGHCGGVATNGKFLWISSENKVYVAVKSSTDYNDIAAEIIEKAKLSLKPVEEGKDAPDLSIKFTYSFNANCNGSFLYYYDADDGVSSYPSSSDKLYVGEFYRGGKYETPESHHVKMPDGVTNRAFAYEYNINTSTATSNKTGLSCIDSTKLSADSGDVPKVEKIFSIPDEIQGWARTSGGALILSQSYGLKNSKLFYYDWNEVIKSANRKTYNDIFERPFTYDGVKTKSGAPATDANTGSTNIYVYNLYNTVKDTKNPDPDDKNVYPYVRGYDIPCMSEGLCVSNGRIYVLFESAFNIYKYFVRQQLTNVYSFIPTPRA